MLVKRLALAADTATLFEFDEFASNAVIVKNETAGEVLFCDGPFDAAAAAHIPAYSWQALNVRIHTDRPPSFYVKAAVSGTVEVDFGSSGMGTLIGSAFDAAGMMPHTLTFSAADGATLTATLMRLHGETLDLETPVSLLSGATVFSGDMVSFAATATQQGFHPVLNVNGEGVELAQGAATIIVSGETTAKAVAAQDEGA